ncbi:MAG: hypothetical protein AAGD10_08635 [Myxococcota bacterium]
MRYAFLFVLGLASCDNRCDRLQECCEAFTSDREGFDAAFCDIPPNNDGEQCELSRRTFQVGPNIPEACLD